ncbi:hypothetical protein QOZ80_9AG0682560 [Eleusine coracana subsp. coracana]|nr:hypothetical protein QOZ80_9AG0682560 [Eleusine coracana subsp. coracana]
MKNAAGSAHNDRLLGGLLSPDIDETTCHSRYKASKHWKPSTLPVSPYLVRKLRQYEENHRHCGPGTAPYRAALAQLMSGADGRNNAECKFVVWLPVKGLGNRMLSVVSTFLYALLTGRVILIHQPRKMEGLFCEPFPGTSWQLPPDFPHKDGFSAGSKESYVMMLQNGIVRYDDDGDDNGTSGGGTLLPPFVYLHLESMKQIRRHTFFKGLEGSNFRLQNHTFCEEDHRVLDKFTWMVLQSDSYFAVALFLMPRYKDELDRMFPSKGAVFHHLGRYLLHPGNRAWELVERFYNGYLAGADERLGIQVRIMPYLPMPFEVMYEQIIRCTREHDLLPQVAEYTCDAATGKQPAKVKAVLLVLLKSEYFDKLHTLYHRNATVTGELVTVNQPSHDQEQQSDDLAHNERALAEIFLLSYCDKLVTTARSTFGYVAHALAGLEPWLLTSLDWIKMRADTACVKAASVEPCLHQVPSLVCRTEKILYPVTRFPFLHHCEDVPSGLKLFD